MTSGNVIRIVGIGGTLRENSTSLWALQHALEVVRGEGATTQLLDLRRVNLPMYQPDFELDDYEQNVQDFVRVMQHADGFLISTAAYHGSLAGLTKNALDFMEYLADAPRPYLHNKPVGLIATASGEMADVHSITAMINVVHSLRGMALPLSVPIHGAKHVFNAEGKVTSEKIAARLTQLGKMVVETAERLQNNPNAAVQA
ncbi:MAG: NAD(P)H-dependent oxidoreductase [Chloroflexi bacterium]|uniref:NADPH-dependent FMN reductase n=1 Tax=Accumulibacter sp. TaxID=2053492 RepID=UPI001ACE7912|nr:NADPH-dependent FMN reductase [Accumulibacter sp.]MBN8499059.1 NAD(P)H-dependent oxidoreductase [Accumulibacter sp.]MCA0457320.1 NAD(P)H-dependent oxidoreductase [Chloroflexota bacterium]MCC6894919.1 NAD(P)H-dependent oxidoreductase [Anaerolineae bacterium]